ncbi:MAG: response regulator transcription factor [Ardenticatenaceae bacterium]|nr:response regulator transcription factor [Anaerolineales bacterium]MCB8977561.1 response regulator transcription factor [Ardenticatenaceae bacterium]
MSDSEITTHRILAVDDDPFNLRIVSHALQQAEYDVMTAGSGEEALSVITQHGLPHMAIVDIHMPPGMSGFEFCRTVHQFSDLPIIMLTAVNEESTVVEGLEEHAEDYIIKPFNPGELTARVKRVLQRMGDFAYPLRSLTRVDDRLMIDFPGRQALINNKPVSLTPTETKLLYILMRSAGHTVNTDFILRRLWPLEPAYEDRLHVHMHRLRRKIEDKKDKTRPRYISSERGVGYTFRRITDE